MKYLSLLSLFMMFLGAQTVQSQQVVPRKPLVEEKFDKLFLSENFDSSGTYWTTLSNSDNLILVQDGEYILNRKANFSPYAVLGSFNNSLIGYRLVTSIKLEKVGNDESSIGIIFMAQNGGQGGFIFELNKNQQYRLRQIASNSYEYLTGNQKEGGWVKSSFIKGLNFPNLVEVRTAEKNYDVYINNVLLLSFSEIAYKTGGVGFIVGPSSKAKVDFLYLFTNVKGQENQTQIKDKLDNADPENDLLSLAESIITLKTQINKLEEENEDLKQIITTMKSSEKENDDLGLHYEKTIQTLEVQNKHSATIIDSLSKVNAELTKYKEMVAGNDGGDLVITLSRNLKAEKLRNESLQKENQDLKDTLNTLQNTNKQTRNKTNGQQNSSSPADTSKSKKTFTLPPDN